MGFFKRENWHSGLTYRNQCPDCRTVVKYTDYDLDYRPGFADGFVLCPRCEKPLRHNENLAINPDGTPHYGVQTPQEGCPVINFCPQCGNRIGKDDRFCTFCGRRVK